MTNESSSPDGMRDEALNIEQITHHTRLPGTALSNAIDRVVDRIGSWISWIWLLLVAVIVINVLQRHFGLRLFGADLEEVAWHLYAIGFLIGLAYTLRSDHHVRVDLFHEHFSMKAQAWIEFIGLIALMTFLVVLVRDLLPYAQASYASPRVVAPESAGPWEQFRHWISQGERSQAPSGLSARWILKYVVVGSFCLLLAAAFSRWLRCSAALFGLPRPRRAEP
ncbi:MAG TPA: TRAP transporter small permease subunit [Rhodocyclaceae bacterium]|jgi:TRAP-type mannitol/chloroaromatic compound transport system permease small subunit|nr:TRAP transporter small permease subunit [Rhodocyclaceae bacterium]HRQ47229.1 TRAP transporter small permease subunit [Rhodocyclaceae bacterium]